MGVAEKIKQLRYEVGIGQCELAKRVGVSQSMISQLESGARSGKPDTMQAIADELGCSYEELCDQPRPLIQFMRNCKRLSQPQLLAVNEIVLQLIGSGSPAVNQGEAANNIQQPQPIICAYHEPDSGCVWCGQCECGKFPCHLDPRKQ